MGVNYKELKAGGFMRQVQKDNFSMRLKVVGGQVPAKHLQKIYEVAEKFGQGYVHLTSRQSIEIPFIKLEDVEEVTRELLSVGLQPGVCGPRVRTITACQGSAICPSGNIETSKLAEEMDKRYFGRELPHKFKIGMTGCSNNCLKAEENDLGIKGGVLPEWQKELCSFCGLCAAVCPTKAIQVDRTEETVSLNQKQCNFCGKCIKSCPLEAWLGEKGYLVYFGGLFGNQIATGQSLFPMIYDVETLYKVTDKAIEFFEENGKPGERFGLTLNRVGWEKFSEALKEVVK